MATAPCSYASPMVFTQSEATAAQATWCFHLVKSADSTDCTGVVPVATISKAGGAFGAVNGGTTITELTNGWYKIVHNAADLDTLGALSVRIAVATADTLNITHQVTLLDQNIATVPLATGAIAAATFAAGAITAAAVADGAIDAATFATDAIDANALAASAITELQTGLATAAGVSATANPVRNRTVALGTLAADGPTAGTSMLNAASAVVTVTGTFGGGTATVQVCADPLAAVPVWVAYPSATLTSNGSKTITGPINAVRVNMAGSTSPSVVCTAVVSVPKGTK